jgi:hypothetical protein
MALHWQDDLINYNDYQWRPMDVLLDLIRSGFISLNPATAEARQLRSFKHGGPLEKPAIIQPIKRGNYLYLQVEVRSSPTTSRLVGVRLHRLVYWLVNDHIPYGKDVHHKDGNTMNNSIYNLVALYPHEHTKVNREAGVYNKPRISRDDPVVEKILKLHQSGQSLREIARQVGYSYSTCRRIITGTYPFPCGLTVLQFGGPLRYLLGRLEVPPSLEDTRSGTAPWTTSRGSAA